MQECVAYKQLDGGQVQCWACSHGCRITDGGFGSCGIRKNIDGKLFLLTYGKAAAFQVDPVEKKPFFHFLPGLKAYSFGTLGCNFRCKNCQNYGISQMFGWKGAAKDYTYMRWGYPLSPERIVEEAIENGCQSIAYTYNEPTVFLEYALDTMKLAKERGLKNLWVSNGFMTPKVVSLILPYLDAINIDIKSFDEEFYQEVCGAHLAPVLENCRRFVKERVWLEITTLVIPGHSDKIQMLKRIAGFIKTELGESVPWHVSAFSGQLSWKFKNLPDTLNETIIKAHQIGKKAGLLYIYAGNVRSEDLENTYCPKCGEAFIERTGYAVARYDRAGECQNCHFKISGLF